MNQGQVQGFYKLLDSVKENIEELKGANSLETYIPLVSYNGQLITADFYHIDDNSDPYAEVYDSRRSDRILPQTIATDSYIKLSREYIKDHFSRGNRGFPLNVYNNPEILLNTLLDLVSKLDSKATTTPSALLNVHFYESGKDFKFLRVLPTDEFEIVSLLAKN